MSYIQYFLSEVYPRSIEILVSPWLARNTFWFILSIIFIVILIDLYFGRYKSEEIGWNTAFGNSISLFWISIIIFRFIIQNNPIKTILSNEIIFKKAVIASILTIWVLLLIYFNFFRILPKKFAFLISSANFTYPLAYVAISVIFGDFILDRTTFFAAILLFLLILLFLYLIRDCVPTSKASELILAKIEHQKQEEREIKKEMLKKKINESLQKLHLKK